MYVTLVGGEPTMRPEIIKVFCEEMPRRVCVVTNGYFPLIRYRNLYFYWISLDGTQKAHDSIRGKGSYAKTKENILEYIKRPVRNGKPAWKDIWLTMTINTQNYSTAIDLAEEWHGKVNKIGYQFHTPFMKGDPLWLEFGEKRNDIVNNLVDLRRKYPEFVINSEKRAITNEGQLGRYRDNTCSMSIMGHTFFGPYGQDQTALLYWERRHEGIKANLRRLWPWMLLRTGCKWNSWRLVKLS